MPSFQVLPIQSVRPRGWLLAQLRRDLEHGFAARLDRLTAHAAHDLFRERIGSSDDFRAWWDAETRGNWLWGYAQMAHLADLPEHRERVAQLLADLLATQDEDGYLGIYADDGRFRHAEGENGELWAQSRALLPLITHYEATNDERVLQSIRRTVDLTLGEYSGAAPYFTRGGSVGRDAITGLTHGLCYVDVLEWLHARTGEARYAEAAVRLYNEFSSMPRPFANDDMALANLLEERHELSGHAVHTAEHLRALLFVHTIAPNVVGNQVVMNALRRLQLYRQPSGALLGDENIHGIPLPEAPYEFCTLTELAFSLSSAVQKLGDSTIADWLETLVFNAVQGARMPDGSSIAYLSADTRLFATANRVDAHSLGAPGRRFKYSPTHDDVACCCNPNAVRVLPHFIRGMWQRLADEDGFAAVAYGPCELHSSVGDIAVTIVEETSYPFSDAIELVVTPEAPVEFTLLLREPAWGGSVDVAVAGVQPTSRNGWIRIRKRWTAGERVRLAFEWSVRTEAYGNREVAVLRGPLQYVLPLEHELKPLRDYDGTELHDYDVVPKDIAQGYDIPVLDASEADLGCTLRAAESSDANRPWDDWLPVLQHADFWLVPIGCTVLRRAAFPLRGSDRRGDQ